MPTGSRVKLAFDYDAKHRRIRKQVWRWTAGAWALHHTIRFAYDGWNLIAELGDAGQPLRTYAWGMDMSGTLQGAGGVGGLLFVQDATEAKTFAAAYDLNGNLIALIDQAIGAAAAQYEYGPFGEALRATGAMAKVNPFRWSTRYTDQETGIVGYPRRPYQPSTGRWLSRDPIEERGGVNLYGYVGNNPVLKIDPFGSFDPSTGTAYDLFNEWANGTTPDQVNFRDGDRMAEQMKGSEEVGRAVSEIMYQLQYKQCGAAIGPIRVVRSLGNQTLWQHLGYPFDFGGDAYHNPARAFLGSFDGTATLVYVDCCKGIGRVEVHLWDNPRLGSATHVPTPWGYKELADDVNGSPGTPFRSFRVDFLFHIKLGFIPRDEDRKKGIHIFLPPGLPTF